MFPSIEQTPESKVTDLMARLKRLTAKQATLDGSSAMAKVLAEQAESMRRLNLDRILWTRETLLAAIESRKPDYPSMFRNSWASYEEVASEG